MRECKPCVVTFTTDPTHPGLKKLKESCWKFGWPVEVLHRPWRGWGYRLKEVLKTREELLRNGFTHLIGIDAFDCLAVGPSSRFSEAIEALGDPVLTLACEKACWPVPDLANHPKYVERKPKSDWRFAHSQMIVDLTRTWPSTLTDCPDDRDDQLHVHGVYLNDAEGEVKLDEECRIVNSIAFCAPFENFFELDNANPDGILLNRLTGTRPLFAHGNGKTTLQTIDPTHPQGV